MEDQGFKEKRAHPRFHINIPLSYLASNSQEGASSQTNDISTQGLGILSNKELAPGTYLEICIQMIDTGEKIYRKAIVIWSTMVTTVKYRVGLKLEEIKLNPIPLVLRTIKAKRKY